jgi:hypothetical protein
MAESDANSVRNRARHPWLSSVARSRSGLESSPLSDLELHLRRAGAGLELSQELDGRRLDLHAVFTARDVASKEARRGFDLPAFASKGVQPALKMFDSVFGTFESCKVDILEMDVMLNGDMGIVCTVQETNIVLKDGAYEACDGAPNRLL